VKASTMQASPASTPETWGSVLEMAIREVFELMLGCQLTVPESPSEEPMDITAMVGLAGKLCGLMSVQCNTKSSTIMASKMLGVEPAQIGPEMCDAFGEICNMVAGNFKNKISGLGEGCMLSVPTVITGNDYSLHSMIDSPALEVRMLFEGRPMVITLQINN
jgi:chemotaxis protein CheX